ncbi:MAG: tetratricopeptide repeat protein [Chloroflexia bacterium]|nr:tetratricopeptide repeat protein [Chloroflexia bacterium]
MGHSGAGPTRPQRGLLREAGAAARAGDRSEAERLYRKLLEQDPQNAAAWMGLGGVLEEPGQKAACFEKVLELDPVNDDAAASLERLRAVLPTEGEVMTCAFHPRVETVLRCSQCGRPICVRCAQPYPVGQLCPTCVRGRRPAYYQANLLHLAGASGAVLVASFLAGLLARFVLSSLWGFFIAIWAAVAVGGALSRLALWAGQRRRGLVVQITVAVSMVVGHLAGAGPALLRSGVLNLGAFLLYLALAVSATVAWLR